MTYETFARYEPFGWWPSWQGAWQRAWQFPNARTEPRLVLFLVMIFFRFVFHACAVFAVLCCWCGTAGPIFRKGNGQLWASKTVLVQVFSLQIWLDL